MVIALFKNFDVFADLITATILNSICFFKVSNKHFKYITYIWQALGWVTFCKYIVTTISFFVITIHYVNIALAPTVSANAAKVFLEFLWIWKKQGENILITWQTPVGVQA